MYSKLAIVLSVIFFIVGCFFAGYKYGYTVAKNDYLESGEAVQEEINEELENIVNITGSNKYEEIMDRVIENECKKIKNN